MSDLSEIRFAELRLVGSVVFYWDSITNAHKGLRRKPIESWEEMKVKLKERYFPKFYMNCLVVSYTTIIKVGLVLMLVNQGFLRIASIVEDALIDSCPFKIASVVQNISTLHPSKS